MKKVMIRGREFSSQSPKICVSICEKEKEQILSKAIKIMEAGADIIEWRADFFQERVNQAKLLETLEALREEIQDFPLLFTIRTKEEGGNLTITCSEYETLNRCAARSGKIDLMDIQMEVQGQPQEQFIKEIQNCGVKVMASYHNFQEPLEEEAITKVFERGVKTGADAVKIALIGSEDGIRSTSQRQKETCPIPYVLIMMGEAGRFSRVEVRNIGSIMTFASIGEPSAPGQLEIGDVSFV